MTDRQVIRGAVNPPRPGLRINEQPMRKQPETKHERFVRMVETRMGKIIEAFDEFCKLADREYYEATEENKQKILNELRGQVDRVERSFKLGRKTSTFKLE